MKSLKLVLSNDEIISPSNWSSLFCFQFYLKNLCIAGLRKYFLSKTGSKRDRPNGGVIVLPLLSLFCLSISQCLFAHGDLVEQIEQVSILITKDTTNAALFLRRGQLYAQHFEYDAATKDIKIARQLDANLFITDLLLAKIFSATNSPKFALAYINRFLKNQPKNANGLIVRAGIFQQLKKEK